jgi:magnesium transporter
MTHSGAKRSRRRGLKRYHPPGTSPGTLAEPAQAATGPATVGLVVYGADGVDDHTPASVDEAVRLVSPDKQAWLRIVGHQPELLHQLSDRLDVHPLVLEDVVNVGQRPKVEHYDGYLYIVVDVIRAAGDGALDEEQVSLLLFEDLLVSVQEKPSDLFKLVDERLHASKGKMRSMAVDYLAYALVDACVDHFFPLLERFGERLEEIETALLDDPRPATLGVLHAVKREMLRVRKATWPLREMVGALARADSSLVREATRVWLRDVYDHTVQIIDIVETLRETAGQLVELYMSSVSNRMNEVMKVLTVIATIFIPLTFIVGLYGMNFNPRAGPLNMPELNWAWGYPAVWLVMIAVALAMVLMFKRKGWF